MLNDFPKFQTGGATKEKLTSEVVNTWFTCSMKDEIFLGVPKVLCSTLTVVFSTYECAVLLL